MQRKPPKAVAMNEPTSMCPKSKSETKLTELLAATLIESTRMTANDPCIKYAESH